MKDVSELSVRFRSIGLQTPDPEGAGATELAREADAARLRCLDAADLGTRQPVWPV